MISNLKFKPWNY